MWTLSLCSDAPFPVCVLVHVCVEAGGRCPVTSDTNPGNLASLAGREPQRTFHLCVSGQLSGVVLPQSACQPTLLTAWLSFPRRCLRLTCLSEDLVPLKPSSILLETAGCSATVAIISPSVNHWRHYLAIVF